jgi:hypothetical protein
MISFCINPISANEQCSDSQQIYRLVANLVECFAYLLPALGKGRARLVYDPGVEQRHLRQGEHFLASINRLPRQHGAADVKRLWFVFTKNRAKKPPGDQVIQVTVSSPGVEAAQLAGEINEFLIQEHSGWLSFGGLRLTESHRLHVELGGAVICQVNNAHNLNSFRQLLPRYERSPKHREYPYYDSNGERVSAMPLGDDEAQALLLVSLEVANERWAYHETRRTCYCFRHTHSNTFHGYEVEQEQVPSEVWNTLFADRMIPINTTNTGNHG